MKLSIKQIDEYDIFIFTRYIMSTSTASDTQKQQNESIDEVTQQFLSKADDYFQSELKCMFILS